MNNDVLIHNAIKGISNSVDSIISAEGVNSTTVTLGAGATFTGAGERNDKARMMIIVVADVPGTLFLEFSLDGTNWTTTLERIVEPGVRQNAPIVKSKGNRFFRVRYVNGSSAQSVFRIQTEYSNYLEDLNASLNSELPEIIDAKITRPTNYESEVAMGRREGRTVWNKFGYNLDSDVGTELIAAWGGTFDPTTDIISSAQTFTITYDTVTGGGDGLGTTGATLLVINYIDANFEAQVGVVTLSNTGSDVTAFSGVGINRVNVLANGGNGFNNNDITITATTDTTVQAVVPAGGSVTQQCIFHTQINHNFLADYLRFKILKPAGGGTGNGFIVGYSWSRVTQTRYEIFREAYSTTTTTNSLIEINPSQKFPIGGREVLYFVIENSSGNNTVVQGRFSGIEERIN